MFLLLLLRVLHPFRPLTWGTAAERKAKAMQATQMG
jgi:hypothetical protein